MRSRYFYLSVYPQNKVLEFDKTLKLKYTFLSSTIYTQVVPKKNFAVGLLSAEVTIFVLFQQSINQSINQSMNILKPI